MARRRQTTRFSDSASSSSDLPVLKRRYALERELERKGIFQAWDSRNREYVLAKQDQGQGGYERLQHEFSVLARLQHPCIPTPLEVLWQGDKSCYLVEEWRWGQALDEIKWFSLGEVAWIGGQLCEALEYLHGAGLVHRDIKHGNILVVPWEQVSLVDYDLAATLHDPWSKGGTAGYAAPEQWSAGRICFEADIYSLGMVLGTMLTNSPLEDVIRARNFSGLWDDPNLIPSEILPVLDLFDRMIVRQPEARPSLAEIQRALSQVTAS